MSLKELVKVLSYKDLYLVPLTKLDHILSSKQVLCLFDVTWNPCGPGVLMFGLRKSYWTSQC